MTLTETSAPPRAAVRTQEGPGAAAIPVHKTGSPEEVRDWGTHRQGSPWRTGSGPLGKDVALSRARPIKSHRARLLEAREGRLGQTLSKRGLWIDGRVALQGDTMALGAEVVRGDNAHSDNQQGPGRRGPGHCGLGTAQGQLAGRVGVRSKENSSHR